MRVLIVEGEPALGLVWSRHLQRLGARVDLAASDDAATEILRQNTYHVVIHDLDLAGGGAISVADYAGYRQPDTQVIFVTNSCFFSDGSIFNHSVNACAMMATRTPPEDLAALVEHYAETV